MAFQPKLKLLEGSSRLAMGFFNSLINRIECIKPIEGDGILITEEADGSGFTIMLDDNNIVTLNVCSNGEPATIDVYVKPPAA
jgi:hypothetical protein